MLTFRSVDNKESKTQGTPTAGRKQKGFKLRSNKPHSKTSVNQFSTYSAYRLVFLFTHKLYQNSFFHLTTSSLKT